MKVAFVTPSYRGDLERCRLLCESTQRFLPDGVEHLLLIDRRDLSAFRPLEKGPVRIVVGESLMPWWIFRLPGVGRWWASLATPPVRNWIYQQLLKLASVHATDADVLQFVDSDVTLIRPFPLDYLIRDGRVRLQRVTFQDAEHRQWLRVAAGLLGLDAGDVPEGSYVGNLITWTRANVLAMLRRIEEVNGRSWVAAVASRLQFSEYMAYGLFVDRLVGIEASGHFPDSSPNLHLCWDYDVRSQAGRERFFRETPEQALGVMIHSKYGIPVSDYRAGIEALWRRGSASSPTAPAAAR